MGQDDQFRRFGAYLRSARKRRGLTLKQVAEASAHVATTPTGRISHPYLSQIETGKTIALSLSKLLTLASVYLLNPEEVVEQAPAALRAALLDDWGQWREARRPEPEPATYLPKQIQDARCDIDGVLGKLAVAVKIPFAYEQQARALIRDSMVDVALPAFLHDDADAPAFWKEGPHTTGWSEAPDYTWLWEGIVRDFREWLLYGHRRIAPLFAPVASWSLEFAPVGSAPIGAELLSCAFRDPEHQQVYGLSRIPLVAARAVRWRQSAWLLRATAPDSLGLPDPPEPAAGLLDYIDYIIHPAEATLVLMPGIAPAELVARLSSLFERLDIAKHKRSASPRTNMNALATFFNSASKTSPRSKRMASAG